MQPAPNTGQTIIDLVNQLSPTGLAWYATISGKPIQTTTTATVQAVSGSTAGTGILVLGLGLVAVLFLFKR
jgi:hypothetical protein